MTDPTLEHWKDRALMAEALLESARDDVDRLQAEVAKLKEDAEGRLQEKKPRSIGYDVGGPKDIARHYYGCMDEFFDPVMTEALKGAMTKIPDWAHEPARLEVIVDRVERSIVLRLGNSFYALGEAKVDEVMRGNTEFCRRIASSLLKGAEPREVLFLAKEIFQQVTRLQL